MIKTKMPTPEKIYVEVKVHRTALLSCSKGRRSGRKIYLLYLKLQNPTSFFSHDIGNDAEELYFQISIKIYANLV